LTRFVFASKDQPHTRRREGFERLERGIDVRPLRVVDPADTVELTHENHAMWQTGKRSERDLHADLIDAERLDGQPRGKRVLDIRHSFQLQRSSRNAALLAIDAQDEIAAVEKRAILD